ncbi:MAG: hypothetical protein R2883_08025 [Caldisericia bacterium]
MGDFDYVPKTESVLFNESSYEDGKIPTLAEKIHLTSKRLSRKTKMIPEEISRLLIHSENLTEIPRTGYVLEGA